MVSVIFIWSKQQVPITSKSPNFKGETQRYVVKLPKSAGARQYCLNIPQVPGTRGTHTNYILESKLLAPVVRAEQHAPYTHFLPRLAIARKESNLTKLKSI